MENKFTLKWVVLAMLLVLPILFYLIFVYSAEENFFQTLEYVGEDQVVEVGGKVDTIPYRIPEFSFVNQDGQNFTTTDIQGKISVMSFFFTYCPTVCPAMNFHLSDVAKRFKGAPYFQIISHTVDPRHDTVEVLKQYQITQNYTELPWQFLTGPKDEIYNQAFAYFLNAQKDSLAPGGFLHSESVVLVDWNGHIRSRLDENGNLMGAYDVSNPTQLGDLKDDIKVLIAEFEREKSIQEKRIEDLKKNESK